MADSTDMCTTPACIQAASRILTNIHPEYKSIDPCTDFDAYACGGYPAQHPFEASDIFTDLQNQNKDVLVQLLSHPYEPLGGATDDDEDVFNMVAGDFAACLNVDAIEKGGLAGVPDMIAQVQRLFPIEDYKSNQGLASLGYEKYADAIAYLNSVGTAVFGDFSTVVDVQNPSSIIPTYNLINPSSSDKAVPATYDIASLASTSTITDVEEQIKAVLPQAAGQGATHQLASNLLSFSTELAQIYTTGLTLSSVDIESLYYYTTTVEEASKVAPALAFQQIIKNRALEGYKVDRIQMQAPDVWANVSTLLSQTPPATIQAAIIFSAYGNYQPYINGSVDPAKDRTEECANYLDKGLAWMSSKLYVEKKYNDEDRDAVTTMMRKLVASFGERVDKVSWMDDHTKSLVLEKLNKMALRIGYPDEAPDALNATSLKEYYKGVNITGSHFSNPNYGVHSWITNARQWRERNTALVPAGVSQSPLFSRNTPSYLSYGHLGSIAAHEVTHGFDSIGRYFNQDTVLQDWWTKPSADAFDNKTQCFVNQYSRVPVVGWDGVVAKSEKNETIYVSGELTLPENIADTGGLVTSYDTWKKLDNDCPEKNLPGLEHLTRDQLFFISFGQTWCSRLTANQAATPDAHAPPFARTRITPQNSGAFREAFKCPKKEPTCEIW
ncbi:hypothetical protein F4678DRAFT_484190 [Xylaria arbuscula]|nr:hypothetical protein F4678DRAFT_484190 [Xylaria arbuscula]